MTYRPPAHVASQRGSTPRPGLSGRRAVRCRGPLDRPIVAPSRSAPCDLAEPALGSVAYGLARPHPAERTTRRRAAQSERETHGPALSHPRHGVGGMGLRFLRPDAVLLSPGGDQTRPGPGGHGALPPA